MSPIAEARELSDREFTMERTFRAPMAKVFAAYTDPNLLPRWWPPRGGSLKVEAMDLRPGGGYRFVQRDASGRTVVVVGTYLEIVPVTRLVYTFGFEGQGNGITATVELSESGGETLLRLTNLCESRTARDMALRYGADTGARAAWSRLDKLLADGGPAPSP